MRFLSLGLGVTAVAMISGETPEAAARGGGPIPCDVGAHVELGSTTLVGFPAPGKSVTLSSTQVRIAGSRHSNPPGVAGGNNCGDFDAPTSQLTWALVARPPGSSASVTGATTLSPQLSLDLAGDYTVRLTACPNGCTEPSLFPSLYPATVAARAQRDVTVHAASPRDLLVEAFNQLKPNLVSKYGLDATATLDASALPLLVNQPLLTYAAPLADKGPITLEVHAQAPSVWIGVPHPDGHAFLSFEMERQTNGQYLPRRQPSVLSTPFPAWGHVTNIQNSFLFTNNGTYQVGGSAPGLGDTPHWLPVFTTEALIGVKDSNLGLDQGLHATIWADPGQGQAIINSYQPASNFNSLRDRAQVSWWTTTVRGTVEAGAGISSNDFGWDHSQGFREDHDTAYNHGWEWSVSDPTWNGQDYDVLIDADADTSYMSSDNDTGKVEMEIEHYLIPPAYRPQGGDWLQAMGRLVLDDGHPSTDGNGNNHYHSEIHPAELLVSSQPKGALGVVARVIATGDWLGGPMSFVVNPPPRPSPTATLSFVTRRADGTLNQFDQNLHTHLTLTAMPPDAPTYVLGTIEGTGGSGLILYDSGQVAATNTRGLQVFVEATWNEPSTFVSARLSKGPTTPALGAHLFYRRAASTQAAWQYVDVDAQGHAEIASLLPEAYYFRPAGSGADFTGVPQLVSLKPGANNLVFGGGLVLHPTPPGGLIVTQSRAVNGAWNPRVAGAGFVAGGVVATLDPLAIAAYDQYTQKLVAIDQNTGDGEVGVVNNGLGAPSQVPILIHLASCVDGSGQPIKDLSSSYKRPLQGPNGSQYYPNVPGVDPFLAGFQGPGVAGAVLDVQLILGNAQAGYRTVAELPSVTTDAHGVAGIMLQAGTHVEDALIAVYVTTNPTNTWFTPSIRATPLLFFPAKTTDDAIAQTPYALTLLPTPMISPHYPELMGEISEVEAVSNGVRASRARGTAPPQARWVEAPFPQLAPGLIRNAGGVLVAP